MIKRNYFIAVRKSAGDGSLTYSWSYSHFSKWSFFDQSEKALAEALDQLRNDMAHKPGGEIEVICFARC